MNADRIQKIMQEETELTARSMMAAIVAGIDRRAQGKVVDGRAGMFALDLLADQQARIMQRIMDEDVGLRGPHVAVDPVEKLHSSIFGESRLEAVSDKRLGVELLYKLLHEGKIEYMDALASATVSRLAGNTDAVVTWVETGLSLDEILRRLGEM